MAKRRIIHMFFQGEQASPFDINMAVDAGYELAFPYTGVTPGAIGDLIQDAIFSRPPQSFAASGAFIGGYDVNAAADMFANARAAQVPPFEVSLFVDPNGAYTTSAALVAKLLPPLGIHSGGDLAGRRVKVFGGGPVGLCTAVLVAQLGGEATLVRLTDSANKPERQRVVTDFAARFEVELLSAPGQNDAAKGRGPC